MEAIERGRGRRCSSQRYWIPDCDDDDDDDDDTKRLASKGGADRKLDQDMYLHYKK